MAKGFTVWFTGLSGSGKSTVSESVTQELRKMNLRVEHLDGDTVRDIFPQTGFSKEARNQHIQRVGFLASKLAQNGVFVTASFISPYRESREFVRKLCPKFIEIHVATPVEECERRDRKGLYAKARRGEIQNFTGVNDPYEPPEDAEIKVDTSEETPEESHDKIIRTLEILGYIPKMDGVEYSEEEEAKIKKRLKDLGYI